jgi:hypothetical protein
MHATGSRVHAYVRNQSYSSNINAKSQSVKASIVSDTADETLG